MTNVQFIYFDLDDTLLDHRHAERAALSDVKQIFDEAFSGISDETIHATYHEHSVPLWRQYAAGEIDKADLKIGRFEKLLDALGIRSLDAEALSDHYLARYAQHWRFVPGAREAFLQLADRFPVGVLTNGFTEIQTAKFDRFPVLRDHTHSVVISEETGYMKPHPNVFAHAAEAANTTADDILYVGDSYHSDVQGGRTAGWQVAWFVRNGNAEADENCFTFARWEMLIERLL